MTPAAPDSPVGEPAPWPARVALWAFASFAFAYFFSALLRGVIATLAPRFSAELGLTAGDLGLLSGAYFLGFAATQLPLGSALDRLGPRRVLLGLLTLAVLGCAAFALARDLAGLILARVLIGVGVSACLMAPMTAYRHGLGPVVQMRANAWMLMAGSLGMVASTLPVQWLLPSLGWRGLFWGVAILVGVSMLGIALSVPMDKVAVRRLPGEQPGPNPPGYAAVWRHPTFVRMAPLGFFHYGGMIAVQSLWAGPWMLEVSGASAAQSAQGLFAINVSMLLAFLGWGLAVPRLFACGWTAQRLIAWGAPLSLLVLLVAIALGPAAHAGVWALYCVTCTVVSLSQPAVGQAFDRGLAGRALSAYNLMVFAGVFALQWGMGLAIDQVRAAGGSTLSAYRGAFALLAGTGVVSYLWFLWRDDRGALTPPAAST